jgi:CheY-like chemotaxis protein
MLEDNMVNQKLAIRLLQQMGYKADTAGNGLKYSKTCDQILMLFL